MWLLSLQMLLMCQTFDIEMVHKEYSPLCLLRPNWAESWSNDRPDVRYRGKGVFLMCPLPLLHL